MFGIRELWLFVISGLLLNIAPGPDTAYIVGRSIQLGWRGGAAAALGISCGCLVLVFGAALGLSALPIFCMLASRCCFRTARKSAPARWAKAARYRWARCFGKVL